MSVSFVQHYSLNIPLFTACFWGVTGFAMIPWATAIEYISFMTTSL